LAPACVEVAFRGNAERDHCREMSSRSRHPDPRAAKSTSRPEGAAATSPKTWPKGSYPSSRKRR